MKSIGIDLVEVHRFKAFYQKSSRQLQRLFSLDEITYCCQSPTKSAERFAARFAAKEAAYKALSAIHPLPPFLTFARNCTVAKTAATPYLKVDWQTLNIPPEHMHISLTHTATIAQALVIID